jgi:glutathione S-transferase
MLELYHTVNSVCAQKVRIVLDEKQLAWQERVMTLRGDQFEPWYLKLNPNGVVPTLIHDGRAVIESSVILYYLEDVFPEVPMMPAAPLDRARVRMFNKLVDEYVHYGCAILSFATAFRPRMQKLMPDVREDWHARTPNRKFAAYKRDVIEKGLASGYVKEALESHDKMLNWMEEGLASSPYLAGDGYSLADVAVIPYVLRLELLNLAGMWADRPRVAAWWRRMQERPSTNSAILDRMGQAEYEPFRNIEEGSVAFGARAAQFQMKISR